MSATGYVLRIDRHGNISREAYDAENTQEQLQRCVGGLIERVEIPAFSREGIDCDCYVDEEGLLKPYPVLNIAVSMMAGRKIVGDAVLVMHDGEGGSAGIPEPLARVLAKYAKKAYAFGVICRMRFAPVARKESEDATSK